MTDQSRITRCTETDCMYNMDEMCHTLAITVGDTCPACDTFIRGDEKGGFKEMTGSVGACKIPGCEFNSSMECMAGEIVIGNHGGHPDCLTYRRK